MTKLVNFGLALMLVAVVAGCEWESSGDEGSWNDSYSWINFSGLYRASSGMLVGEFASAGTTTSPGGNGSTAPVTVVNNEDGGTAPANATELSGTLGNRPGIVPGSVTITLNPADPTGSAGSVTDNGAGVLEGSFNLVGIDPSSANPMNGTINYDTGVWTLSLGSPGLLTSAQILANYTFNATEATVVDGGGGADSSSSMGIAGGDVMTMLVEQVGNKLRFVDSNGNSYEGFLSVVSLAGGDSTGQSSGAVSATYEVKGVAAGQTVKISGSFSGAYLSPAEANSGDDDTPRIYGRLTDRIMEGIWMQPDGTADVYGIAPQVSVQVQTTTTTTE